MKVIQKAALLEQIKDAVLRKLPEAHETDNAEADLLALTLQSASHSERHVWIDLYEGESVINVDLEDWDTGSEWDHAVKRSTVTSMQEAVDIVVNWLSGKNL